MNNKPFALTNDEIKEIAAFTELQEMWGFEAAEMESVIRSVYTVRFDFVSGSPGYVGDLFIIQSDYLDSDNPATRLYRGKDNKLMILN